MWHQTTETPREGARIICIVGTQEILRWLVYMGERASIREKVVWGGTRHWAYAPGEEG